MYPIQPYTGLSHWNTKSLMRRYTKTVGQSVVYTSRTALCNRQSIRPVCRLWHPVVPKRMIASSLSVLGTTTLAPVEIRWILHRRLYTKVVLVTSIRWKIQVRPSKFTRRAVISVLKGITQKIAAAIRPIAHFFRGWIVAEIRLSQKTKMQSI